MALTKRQQLALANASAVKRKKKVQEKEELLSLVADTVVKFVPHVKDGVQGPQGPVGPQGQNGKDVDLGEVKSFIESYIEARIPKSSGIAKAGGGGSPFKFITTIDTDTYYINKSELKAGVNIFGVNYAGAVTVYLPRAHHTLRDKAIVINDESGNANSNNITIRTQ